MARSTPFSAFDYAVLAYLISHIPITLLVDAQSVFPSLYPQPLRDMITWYAGWSNDILMENPPPWFRAITFAETFLQVPYFFLAVAAWLNKSEFVKGVNMRTATIVYGAHVATTLLPILGTFWSETRCEPTRVTLTAIYSPYLIMPLLMLWKAAASDRLFPEEAPQEGSKKRA